MIFVVKFEEGQRKERKVRPKNNKSFIFFHLLKSPNVCVSENVCKCVCVRVRVKERERER